MDYLPVILTLIVVSVFAAVSHRLFERWWFPLAKPGSNAYAWIMDGRNSKRGLISTSDLDCVAIRLPDGETVEYRASVLEDPVRPALRDALRVGLGYSVKLDCGRLHVFLRRQDCKTLQLTLRDAPGSSPN